MSTKSDDNAKISVHNLIHNSMQYPLGYEYQTFKHDNFHIIFHKDHFYGSSFTAHTTKYYRFISHWHENVEVLYILDGTSLVRCGDNSITVTAGDIVIINSGEFHDVIPSTDEITYYCLIVDREFLKENGINTDECIFEEKSTDEKIKEYISEIANALITKDELYKLRCNTLALLIFERLYTHWRKTRVLSPRTETPANAIYKRVLKYINENFNKKISIDEMAHSINISKYYMCHCFKECSGKSILEFVNLYRCERAKQLISTKKISIADAAEICGFSNMSYFSKIFKKYVGFLPKEIKAQAIPFETSKDKGIK